MSVFRFVCEMCGLDTTNEISGSMPRGKDAHFDGEKYTTGYVCEHQYACATRLLARAVLTLAAALTAPEEEEKDAVHSAGG